jgi:hypothetical protein
MADLAHRADDDTDLLGDTNAAHWAERFASKIRLPLGHPAIEFAGKPVCTTGEFRDLMLAWFAAAIETGRMSRP